MKKIIKIDKKEIKKIKKRKAVNKKQFTLKITKTNIFVVLVILLGFIVYYLINKYHVATMLFNKNNSYENATVIDTSTTNAVINGYNKYLLIFENNKLIAYNSSGKVVWKKSFEDVYSAKINVAGSYIQIINENTGYIYILNGQYETARIKIDGNILSATINESGTSVVEYSNNGIKTVFGVYSSKGKELYNMKLNTNTVSTYSISDNSRYLAYVYADISGISLVTKVDIIDLSKLGTESYNYTTIIEEKNDLVYKMYWERKHTLFNDEGLFVKV